MRLFRKFWGMGTGASPLSILVGIQGFFRLICQDISRTNIPYFAIRLILAAWR